MALKRLRVQVPLIPQMIKIKIESSSAGEGKSTVAALVQALLTRLDYEVEVHSTKIGEANKVQKICDSLPRGIPYPKMEPVSQPRAKVRVIIYG